MPVLLSKADADAWLGSGEDTPRLLELLRPFPAELMECHPVSKLVNSPKNNRPELIEPAT